MPRIERKVHLALIV